MKFSFKKARQSISQHISTMWNKTGVRQWLLAVLSFLAIVGLLVANLFPTPDELVVGQVATRDIVAPFRIENTYKTSQEQEKEARRAELEAIANDAYYVIKSSAAEQAEERVAAIFSMIRSAQEDIRSVPEVATDQLLAIGERLGSEIATERGLDVPLESLHAALALSEDELAVAEDEAIQLATATMEKERISTDRVAAVRERVLTEVGNKSLSTGVRLAVSGIVQSVITPNLTLDEERVEEARRQAIAQVEPVFVEQGQIIVRWGDVIEPEHMSVLMELGLLRPQTDFRVVLGIVLTVGIFMALLGVYLYQHEQRVLQNERLLTLLALLLVVMAGIAKLFSVVPFSGTVYLVPVALVTMTVAILLDSRLALVTALFLSVIVGIVSDNQQFQLSTVALVGGVTGVFSVSSISQRGNLTRAGLIVGLATFSTMLAIGLATSDVFMIRFSFLGLVNGFISAIGTIGVLPYIESMFGITSSMRLLELSNPNQPLLRKLLLEAPGTYHHSMLVGNLSEAAAEAIGGDPLLTRVGAQYHDIGKVKRPYFFAENQLSGINPHDKISPSLSTLIITSHVKDGLEMARQHKLPEVLIDFIREHHGTSLVKYFYHRAKEEDEDVVEDDFRYPGPKPQSKETAVVMLADAVEAAVRAMPKPTPGKIEGLVRKIIKERLSEGQLDESNVTLRDLDHIADAFVRVLTGIFHHRVEYPEESLPEQKSETEQKKKRNDHNEQ